MESYEEKSDQAAVDADKLAEEGEHVERQIAETRRDVQAKQGAPGMEGAVPDPDPESGSEGGEDPREPGDGPSDSGDGGSEAGDGASDSGGGGE